jgi:hypothetical protein
MGQEVIMAHYVRHSSLSRDPLQGREEKWGKGFLWKRRKSVEKGDLSLGRLQGSLCSGSSVCSRTDFRFRVHSGMQEEYRGLGYAIELWWRKKGWQC